MRHVSALPAGSVPAYSAANVRAAWQASRHLEVALVGQDLLEASHIEWIGGSGVRRSGFVTLSWRP